MRILIAEDQTPIIEVLKSLIMESYPSAEVNCTQLIREALHLLDLYKFDLVITDLDFSEGKRFVVAIEAKKQAIPCIIYSLYHNKTLTNRAKELDVRAYICKLGPLSEIKNALENYPKMTDFICSETISRQKKSSRRPISIVKLKSKEEQVLKLIIHGSTQTEIAAKLGLKHNTVKSYLRDIIKTNKATLPQIIKNYLEWNHTD